MSKKDEALKLALEALEEIALAGMSVAPEMIDSKEAFHARQAWRFIGIAARAMEPVKKALAEQGCDYCNHPQYAGTKCKNCGREQPAQQEPSMFYKVKMCPRQECASAAKCMSVACSSRAYIKPEQPAQQQYTYASTQATMCAGCGEHKHTPLRIDAMGGYVCLTCIDKKLGSLLGEFGYPQPAQHRHISYVCPQCYWSLEEQPAPAPKVREQQEQVGHGGRPMTLRECMEAEEPAGKPWTGLTDEQITAGAIALCKQMAEGCGVDAGDQWRLYADTFKEDAKAVLEAAHGIKGDA